MKPSFAFIAKNNLITKYTGTVVHLKSLSELKTLQQKHSEVLFLNPYKSLQDRGYKAHGNEPIITLLPTKKEMLSIKNFVSQYPIQRLHFSPIRPSISDDTFTTLVGDIIENEIKSGNATQVILSRYFSTQIQDFDENTVVGLFSKALQTHGQYMTLLLADHSQKQPNYFLGTPPERHVEITQDTIAMTPIAGTLKKRTRKTFLDDISTFLEDKKEINELFQVLDEELKIMAHICPNGGRIKGPFLREIGNVIHTEYELEGKRGTLPLIETFTETLHAPTLVGGPLESAARIIHQYETESRRYYGGEFGIISNNTLDSAIFIRCAEIDSHGNVRVQAGAGIVHDSNPNKEMEETRAKASGLLRLLTHTKTLQQRFLNDSIYDAIGPILTKRNTQLSDFLFSYQDHLPPSKSHTITIVNNEDNFAKILAHITRSLGYQTTVIDTFDFDPTAHNTDIVILGPGPGNINDLSHPRMQKLHTITKTLFDQNIPLLGICLGHQIICKTHDIPVKKLSLCTQGIQKEIDVFGETKKVGFYNSFAPHKDDKPLQTFQHKHHIGFQFHPESVMTPKGRSILQHALSTLESFL